MTILSTKQCNAKITNVTMHHLIINIPLKKVMNQFVSLMIVVPLLIISIQENSMKLIIINAQHHVVAYGIMKHLL